MRIVKLVAVDAQTDEKQTFTFGTSSSGKPLIAAKGGRLNSYLEFCFTDEAESVKDVEVEFSVEGQLYSLSKTHTQEGVKTLLKALQNGKWNVVARANATEYVERLIGESVGDMLKQDFVNNAAVEGFDGNLLAFEKIRLLAEVEQTISQSSQEAQRLWDSARSKVKQYASSQNDEPIVTPEQIEEIEVELEEISSKLANATAELADLKEQYAASSFVQDVQRELQLAQEKYNLLIGKQNEIDKLRSALRLREDVDALLPKVNTLKEIIRQKDEYEKKRYAVTSEIEWQQNELDGIEKSLEEKNKLFVATQDKRSRIEGINAELTTIASLYEKNRNLNQRLTDLTEKEQRFAAEKVMYANKLDAIEKSLAELNQSLSEFSIPSKSVGELLEAVRVDVKIDEVTAQIDKLNGEIAVKESRIAEKESNLVVQVKRFRSVAELDVAVTPIKAKDTILQVLDSKYAKLETVNASLEEKLINLRRAAEEYKYKILQVEQSRAVLEGRRDKALLVKQEEFKREVFLNSQKTYSDDASGVFAVTVNFNDSEIDSLNRQIADRVAKKEDYLRRASALEGSIKEIARHIDVNSADMATLNKEKANIVNRYNEIISQNTGEAAFNYVKALSSNNGTQYLLDVQQEVVRSEAELTEEKRTLETLKNKLSSLKSRLKYLADTQTQLDSPQASIDALVSSNDKLRDELASVGEGLASGYEQYKAVARQMEGVDSKLEDVRSAIIEITKTVGVNEDLVEQCNKRARELAGCDDVEQAVANFKYELGDVESERQMLVESKQNVEKELFKKRLELEKTQWLYDSKCNEYSDVYGELKMEFGLRGLDVEQATAMNFDESADEGKKVVADYDAAKKSLAEKIDNLYSVIKNKSVSPIASEQLSAKQREVDFLVERQKRLEEQRRNYMQNYVVASAARMKVTVAAAEAKTLESLRTTIGHNQVMGLLIRDKVNSVVTLASQYFKTFAGKNASFVLDGYTVAVEADGVKTAYVDLPFDVKTAAYVSLLLACPSTDTTDGRWLVFEERIAMDTQALAQMLLNISDVSYVVDYSRE